MSRDVSGEESKALDQVEHNSDGSAKRVSLRAQDPGTGDWVNVAAHDNGDGTFSMSTNPSTPGSVVRTAKVAQVTTITSSTAETTVLTAVAATYLDVYAVIVTNSSSTATRVAFKDATAGTTRFTIAAPASETRGFMLSTDAGHNQSAVNNNWTATVADSVASILITVFAVKNT